MLQQLQRSKLILRTGEPSVGFGERRSRGLGPGMEFMDYRDYVPGDDIRHIDRHVLARLDRAVIRQSSPDQGLHVVVLLDCSASMAFGGHPKLGRATELAGVIAAVAIAGGDQVVLGRFGNDTIEWFNRITSDRSIPQAFRWLASSAAAGKSGMGEVSLQSRTQLRKGGMLIVISDWMVEDAREALVRWRSLEQDLVGVQVLAAEEADPTATASGPARLIDSESADSVDVVLDEAGASSYRAHFEAWRHEMRDLLISHEGRWFPVGSDEHLADVVLRRWRHSLYT